jgi:hypothetical protein
MGTFFGEAFGGGQADASGAAGNQCDFAFEFASHGVSPECYLVSKGLFAVWEKHIDGLIFSK